MKKIIYIISSFLLLANIAICQSVADTNANKVRRTNSNSVPNSATINAHLLSNSVAATNAYRNTPNEVQIHRRSTNKVENIEPPKAVDSLSNKVIKKP